MSDDESYHYSVPWEIARAIRKDERARIIAALREPSDAVVAKATEASVLAAGSKGAHFITFVQIKSALSAAAEFLENNAAKAT